MTPLYRAPQGATKAATVPGEADAERAFLDAARRLPPERVRELVEAHLDETFGVPDRNGRIVGVVHVSGQVPVFFYPDEGGGYWGEVPSIPGCVSQGEDVAGVLANLAEAATGMLTADPYIPPPPRPEISLEYVPAGNPARERRGA